MIMIVVTPNGRITFSRVIGKNQIDVSSEDDNIENCTYDIKYKKNQKKPVVNAVWLKLLGIDSEPMIVRNMNFEKSPLTWKTLLRLAYINEEANAQNGSQVSSE